MTEVVAALGYGVAGWLVISRRPRNAVGWILAAIAVSLVAGTIGDTDSANPYAAWVGQIIWLVWVPALVGIALPLVFPTGRPLWRWVAWVGAAGVALATFASAVDPGPMDGRLELENPFGVAAADTVAPAADSFSTLLLTAAAVGAAVSVIVRLRRSRGVERQQVKWLAYVVALIVGLLVLSTLTGLGLEAIEPIAGLVFAVLVGFGVPAATGIAMLRYRLYEIDVVINRTLVYGALTATLGGAYLAGVLLLQLIVSPSSDLAVAGSTLAVAALFRPARSRIQRAVDRRFYRRRYDAQRTLDAFSARLRDEVALDALGAELRGVVRETMQPAHISLWLRP